MQVRSTSSRPTSARTRSVPHSSRGRPGDVKKRQERLEALERDFRIVIGPGGSRRNITTRGVELAQLVGREFMVGEVRCSGFVLNKFRGDARLLDPAPAELERMTGVQVIGLIPYLHHALPDEDGAPPIATAPRGDSPTVAVIRYPTASNLDEFKPLEAVVRLRWAWAPSDLRGASLVVLPGSKHVASDLAWLREHGFAEAIRERATRREPVLGICGGLQMLGDRIEDAAGVDGSAGGLGLLPLLTRFQAEKITRPAQAQFGSLPHPWSGLSGLGFSGYEIRHGATWPTAAVAEAVEGALGFVHGSVLAIYVHGLFESPAILKAMFGRDVAVGLDETFDELANAVEAALDLSAIDRALEVAAQASS